MFLLRLKHNTQQLPPEHPSFSADNKYHSPWPADDSPDPQNESILPESAPPGSGSPWRFHNKRPAHRGWIPHGNYSDEYLLHRPAALC